MSPPPPILCDVECLRMRPRIRSWRRSHKTLPALSFVYTCEGDASPTLPGHQRALLPARSDSRWGCRTLCAPMKLRSSRSTPSQTRLQFT
eukprot:scaffold3800_cov137-Pinguiococcus_pyrenoidosus.AAC.6